MERVAREAAGGDSHVQDNVLLAAAQAFELCVNGRDLRDALHNRQWATAGLHFKDAAPKFVERRDTQRAADAAYAIPARGNWLPDVDADFLGRRRLKDLGDLGRVDISATKAVVHDDKRRHRHFASLRLGREWVLGDAGQLRIFALEL